MINEQKYYVRKGGGELAGPFTKSDALAKYAEGVRLFFNRMPSPGFFLLGAYDIYDKCTFGIMGPGLPPIFRLRDTLALLHGFVAAQGDGIKVKYLPASPPAPQDFVYGAPGEYIDCCDPSDVERVEGDSLLYTTTEKCKRGDVLWVEYELRIRSDGGGCPGFFICNPLDFDEINEKIKKITGRRLVWIDSYLVGPGAINALFSKFPK